MGFSGDLWIVMLAVMAVFWTLVVVASIWVLHSLTSEPARGGESGPEPGRRDRG
jgi:hypothetical protein